MHDEYEELRRELEVVQRRFEDQRELNPDLKLQVCHYRDENDYDERLAEATWAAFGRANEYDPAGEGRKWHLLNDCRWCGSFFGKGDPMKTFVPLATKAVSILKRLSMASGAGEIFFAKMPAQPDLDAWIRLLRDSGDLCGIPEPNSGTWGVSEEHSLPLPRRAYWSRPDSNGVSYPLHPDYFILGIDVFSASADAISLFLAPPIPVTEYHDGLLPYENEGYCVPPYLPANPWADAENRNTFHNDGEKWTEKIAKGFGGIEESFPEGAQQGGFGDPSKPDWDKDFGELRLGGVLVKKYKQPSFRQKLVLGHFQESGWPVRMKNPFTGVNAIKVLLDTNRQLNKNQKDAHILFEGDGEGGVRWRIPDAAR